jgi:hypothetical protein|tara:strand:+ start:567 stop:989 length:423 start_codon:yes stop_codon:yes gene_type:complete
MTKNMARRKSKPRRRSRSFSLTNAAFSLGYANILSQGLFGTNIAGFILGKTSQGYGASFVSGPGISFSELINIGAGGSPGSEAGNLETIQANLRANLPSMLVQSITLSVTERVFKSVMRRPLSNVQRNIVKPLLGNMVRV